MDIDVAHFNLVRESKENANSNLKVVSVLRVRPCKTWHTSIEMFQVQNHT